MDLCGRESEAAAERDRKLRMTLNFEEEVNKLGVRKTSGPQRLQSRSSTNESFEAELCSLSGIGTTPSTSDALFSLSIRYGLMGGNTPLPNSLDTGVFSCCVAEISQKL